MGDCQTDADKKVVEDMIADRDAIDARVARMKARSLAEEKAARRSPSIQFGPTPPSVDTFHLALDAVHAEARATFDTKNADYARKDDVLAAFKKQAESTGLTMKQVWSVHFTKQVEAVLTWARNGGLEGEPIDSRLADVLNYLAFAQLIESEEG